MVWRYFQTLLEEDFACRFAHGIRSSPAMGCLSHMPSPFPQFLLQHDPVDPKGDENRHDNDDHNTNGGVVSECLQSTATTSDMIAPSRLLTVFTDDRCS